MRTMLMSALAACAVSAIAQGVGGNALYTEVKGDHEFSGTMMARPRQVSEMTAFGIPVREAMAIRQRAANALKKYTLQYHPEVDEFVLDVPWGMDENSFARMLLSTGDYQYVEPNWIVYPVAIPNDPSYGSQWGWPRINAPTAWDHFTGNGSIIVAITDTGIQLNHEDFAGRLVSGANSAGATSTTGPVIPQSGGGLVDDLNGHGSHCAGIAAATGNNALGGTGINWNARIMPIRVSNSSGGGSSINALVSGIRWAADNGARVISTSYSGASNAAVQTTGNYVKVTRNALSCWAAGNSNANFPTDHVDVTIVGSTDPTDVKSSFSNFGPGLDVFAPGSNIFSCWRGSATAYNTISGTSMACPAAAGLATLMTAANPSLSAQTIEDILYQTCFDLTDAPGGPGNDAYWGWGRIDALAALRRVYNNHTFPPSLYTLRNGNAISGGVPEASTSDNVSVSASYAVPVGSFLPVTMEFESTSTNKLTVRLDLTVECRVSKVGMMQSIQMFDFVGGTWVTIDTRGASTTDQTVTLTPPTSPRFRQTGTGIMRARVMFDNFSRTGDRNFTALVDHVAFKTAAS